MSKIVILGQRPNKDILPDIFCFDVPGEVCPEEVIKVFRSGLFEADYTHRIDPVSFATDYVREKMGGSLEILRPDGVIVYEDD